MKVFWEEKDIQAGRKVRKQGCNETWMIGYTSSDEDTRWVLVSTIDGMVTGPGKSKKELVELLNVAKDLPVEILDKFPENGGKK